MSKYIIHITRSLALGDGEFGEEVFVDSADDVLLLISLGVDLVDYIQQRGEFWGSAPRRVSLCFSRALRASSMILQ
ncbi:MAG: hypothetical protein R3Y68_08475 [Rikenellaceae bacterium]